MQQLLQGDYGLVLLGLSLILDQGNRPAHYMLIPDSCQRFFSRAELYPYSKSLSITEDGI
jgi:hypothetical protein